MAASNRKRAVKSCPCVRRAGSAWFEPAQRANGGEGCLDGAAVARGPCGAGHAGQTSSRGVAAGRAAGVASTSAVRRCLPGAAGRPFRNGSGVQGWRGRTHHSTPGCGREAARVEPVGVAAVVGRPRPPERVWMPVAVVPRPVGCRVTSGVPSGCLVRICTSAPGWSAGAGGCTTSTARRSGGDQMIDPDCVAVRLVRPKARLWLLPVVPDAVTSRAWRSTRRGTRT